MKKFTRNRIFAVGLVATMLLSSTLLHAQSWKLKTNLTGFNAGRQGHVAFVADNKIYIGGGNEGAGKSNSGELNVYDPIADKWEIKAKLPGAANRSFSISFTVNGKIYMGLGAENYFSASLKVLKDIWEYDPSTDKWTQKADFGGGPNYGGKVFVVNDKAYVVGGQSGSSLSASGTAETWEYDPSADKWTQKASYPGVDAVANSFAFAINGKGYVASGQVLQTGQSSATVSALSYEYDPTADKWTKKTNCPSSVLGGIAFVIDDKAYCGLGTKDIFNPLNTFHVYDPATDKWTPISSAFPAGGRYNAFAVTMGNKAYVGGGAGTAGAPLHTEVYELAVPVSVKNTFANNTNINAYPNPSSGSINISGLNNTESSRVRIYNILGKEVFSQTVSGSNTTINTSIVPAGQYILTIAESTGVVYRKTISLL